MMSAERISGKHFHGLKALREEGICSHFIIACAEERLRIEEGTEVLLWAEFWDQLWNGRFKSAR